MKTAQEYFESLKDGRTVYCRGERVADVTRHPILRVCAEACAMDYAFAQDPRYSDLFVEQTERGPVSFVYLPAKSAEDLLRRRKIIQILSRTCFGVPGGAKFTGVDGLNALAVVCGRMDRQLGTAYAGRVEAYRHHLQQNDLAVALAMTDVKGDRTLRPSRQQPHRDYYVRIVGERSDGIVVRGAKTHISLSPCVNEIIVLPCRSMVEEDSDYAVAFAAPVNTPGITLISSGRDAIEEGNYDDYPVAASIYSADALVVFDDVFVPMERVFMKREWGLAGQMAYMFANFHRLSADAYKYAELEILVGAAALMAEYNGLEKVEHVREKLAWLVLYAEGTEALGRAACQNCVIEPDSGLAYPDPMYSNVAKFFFADNFHQAVKYTQDIAGGIAATIPWFADFANPQTRPLLEKYLGGKAGLPTEYRIRATKLVKDITSSHHEVTTIHAEGSLAAQMLSVYALGDFSRYKAAARRAAGIRNGSEHPVFRELLPFPARRSQ